MFFFFLIPLPNYAAAVCNFTICIIFNIKLQIHAYKHFQINPKKCSQVGLFAVLLVIKEAIK